MPDYSIRPRSDPVLAMIIEQSVDGNAEYLIDALRANGYGRLADSL